MVLMSLVLIGIIVGIVMAVRHERDVGPSSPGAPRPAKDSARKPITNQRELSRMLDGWVVDGLISDEQARAILDREHSRAPAAAPATVGRSHPRSFPSTGSPGRSSANLVRPSPEPPEPFTVCP